MAPRWAEILVILFGLPILALSLYFIIPGLFEDISKIIHIGILVVFTSVCIIFGDRSRKAQGVTNKEHHNLNIKVDKNIVTCNFKSQTNLFDLYKIDWAVTRITPEKLTKSLVIAEIGKEPKGYPIFYMEAQDRRKLWKSIIKYRP